MIHRKFHIDFFEFAFLVEACIPPRPIARSMFWDNVIDHYYHDMNENERAKLFEWITANPCFDMANDDCFLFHARFNPDNQYNVKVNYGKEEVVIPAFKLNDIYHTAKNTSINEKYIIDVQKINK
jgi:hypothetical protein